MSYTCGHCKNQVGMITKDPMYEIWLCKVCLRMYMKNAELNEKLKLAKLQKGIK